MQDEITELRADVDEMNTNENQSMMIDEKTGEVYFIPAGSEITTEEEIQSKEGDADG